jgi:hypothetical protein
MSHDLKRIVNARKPLAHQTRPRVLERHQADRIQVVPPFDPTRRSPNSEDEMVGAKAFSSEVDTGSRQENAIKQRSGAAF